MFLSGNGPLVEVLQYELKSAGGGGSTFVRDVLNYVKRYSAKADLVPPEHVLVYDEAQRAFDAGQVARRNMATDQVLLMVNLSLSILFEFAERIPEWCVVVGLIGRGQEIHIGEEGGIIQWRHAVEKKRISQINGQSIIPMESQQYSMILKLNMRRAMRCICRRRICRFHLAQGVPHLC